MDVEFGVMFELAMLEFMLVSDGVEFGVDVGIGVGVVTVAVVFVDTWIYIVFANGCGGVYI